MKSKKINAGFVPRLFAMWIDGLLVGAMFPLLVWWVTQSIDIQMVTTRSIIGITLFILWSFVASWGYKILFLTKWGQTIGKAVLGLEVVKDGKLLTWKEVVFREFIGKAVSAFLFGLGYLYVLKDKKNRAWHDMLAGTQVTTKEDRHWFIGLVIVVLLLTFHAGVYFLAFQNVVNGIGM